MRKGERARGPEVEGLVARAVGVGVDAAEVQAVAGKVEVGDPVAVGVGGGAEDEGVGARAAGQRVGAGAGDEAVVAAAARKRVAAGAAEEGVVAGQPEMRSLPPLP